MLRIISGKLKGRQIAVPEDGTKPLTDRIKTSLFDLLRDFFTNDASVLDLFSGSGNFAIEALSRGAGSAVLVDKGDEQAAIIRKNLEQLGLKARTEVRHQDAFSFLSQNTRDFDIIMLDPPFPMPVEKKQELFCAALACLRQEGVLIFRFPAKENYVFEDTANFREVYRKQYGISTVSFWRKM